MNKAIALPALFLLGSCFTMPRRGDREVFDASGVSLSMVGAQCGQRVDELSGHIGWIDLLVEVRNGGGASLVVDGRRSELAATGQPPLRCERAPEAGTVAPHERWLVPLRYESPALACSSDFALVTDGVLQAGGAPLHLPPLRFGL